MLRVNVSSHFSLSHFLNFNHIQSFLPFINNHIDILPYSDVRDFNDMIAKLGLIDGGFSGQKYTWTNNRLRSHRILERIDRVLYNNEWSDLFNTEVTHLSRHCSDHTPLLVHIGPLSGVGSSFRFVNAW